MADPRASRIALRARRLVSAVWCVPFAAAVLGCSDPGSPALPQGDITIVLNSVAQDSRGFSPNPLVKSSATVTWVNADYSASSGDMMDGGMMDGMTGTPHRLISDEGLFDSGTLDPTETFSFTFPGPGTYHYHCLNHPGMTGMVTITQ